MVSLEIIDEKKIRIMESFDAPLGFLFELWSDIRIEKVFNPLLSKKKYHAGFDEAKFNEDYTNKQIRCAQKMAYQEVSTTAFICSSTKITTRFVQNPDTTEISFTIDFLSPGLLTQYMNDTVNRVAEYCYHLSEWLQINQRSNPEMAVQTLKKLEMELPPNHG
ncbi:hypothetical protein [Marinicella sp. W31]|uniref:hypothetical protein n=1 Tax=Marinicella sp. W31 TaxID=3023713 RepID=UPI0037570024